MIKDLSEAAEDHAGLHEVALQEKPRQNAITKVNGTDNETVQTVHKEKRAHAR